MIQCFGCYEEACIYSKGWQVQNIGQKQQSESIHLMCESIQTTKWQDRWTMKIDTPQTLFESIQSPDEDVYDSNSYESIQSTSESFMIQFTEIWIDSGREEGKLTLSTIESIHSFSESIHMNQFKKTVNRFIVILFRKTVNWFTVILFRKIWLDSKGDTRKMDRRNAWYESMNHESNQAIHGRIFLYMTTHKTSRNHMTQWDMVF